MNYQNVGVVSFGVKLPILKEGDDLVSAVVESVISSCNSIHDKDVIGITESIVARVEGNYVTVDEIADYVKKLYGEHAKIAVCAPIYSRNRFSMILKGIARGVDEIVMFAPEYDEVGNPFGVNPFTGCDIEKYYGDICEAENCKFSVADGLTEFYSKFGVDEDMKVLNCGLHIDKEKYNLFKSMADSSFYYTLEDICKEKCEYGLLGSNKATEEKLKLFPSKAFAQKVCEDVKREISVKTGANVIVCVYGDGCFHDPVAGIWEFADPVTMPAFTDEDIIMSTPNEIKIKYFADEKFKDLSGEELSDAIRAEIKTKKENLVGEMTSEGTTPRLRRDLLASLMDLTSGSGDRGTPVVVVKGYFVDYSS